MRYLFFVLLLTVFGCKTPLPADFDPTGKLVYVEALDDSDGSHAGDFGDVVVLDPQTKVKYRLTHDRLYDEDARWFPDGLKVVFASRRIGNSRYKDLSTPSHLYEVSLKTQMIDRIDEKYVARLKNFPDLDGSEFFCPVYNYSGTELAFFIFRNSSVGDPGWQLIIHDLKNDSLVPLGDGTRGHFNLRWSEDDRLIAYTEFRSSNPTSGIAFSVFSRDSLKRVKRISQKEWSYSACSFFGNTLYYTGRDFGFDNPPTQLYVLDLDSLKSLPIHTFKEFTVNEFVVSDSTGAYLLAEDANHRNDIYFFDLRTKESTRITTDGLQKIGLDYLREKKK